MPIKDEPHHRLLLKNDFVNVYNVVVPPLDATFLHQHDLLHRNIQHATLEVEMSDSPCDEPDC